MILKNKILFFLLFVFLSVEVNSQTLKVALSPDERKVNRNTKDGISTIIFDSKVKDLKIDNGTDDQWMKPSEDIFVYFVDTKKDLERGYELSQRNFTLNSPKSAEYLLEIDEIFPNQVLYYTVVLPKQIPVTLSLEWMTGATRTGASGVRVGYGGRYGFVAGYTWGEYRPSGDNIDNITTDCDLTYAKPIGYIKTTIFGGLRLGLFYNDNKMMSMHMYMGVGYGEYARQWENKVVMENSRYFYSDYMKGVNVNMGINFNLLYWVYSFGVDVVMSEGKFVIECQGGIGYCIPVPSKNKHKKKMYED